MKSATTLALTLVACTPMLPSDPTTSSTTSSGDATDGVSETGAPTPTTSSASSTTTSSTSSTTGSESSSGEPQGGLYDPCLGASECDPEVADGCAEGPEDGLGFCSALCTTGLPCPADESGLGTPICVLDLFDAPAVCALGCENEACPPDLECVEFRSFSLCM